MAPQGLSCLLGLEITSTATRPPASPCRGQNIDPAHDAGESAVGRATRPWRTSQAWDRDQSGRCFQIHDPAPEAAIAELADIPSEPCGLSGVCRFLRRADCHVSALVRVHHPAPRASSSVHGFRPWESTKFSPPPDHPGRRPTRNASSERSRSSLSHKSAAFIIGTNGSPPNPCGLLS